MGKKKKNRQQKIIASLKKEIKISQTQASSERSSLENLAPTYVLPTIRKEKEMVLTNLELPQNSYLKKDLTKTLILSILAISLELMVYFLSG